MKDLIKNGLHRILVLEHEFLPDSLGTSRIETDDSLSFIVLTLFNEHTIHPSILDLKEVVFFLSVGDVLSV